MMPRYDDSLPTCCATDPASGSAALIHNVNAADVGERHLIPTHCPEHDPGCALDDSEFGPDGRCAAGHTRGESDAYEAHYAALEHDCPKQDFLDDPITVAYGVGAEMVRLVPCPVCDEL